MSKGFRKQPYAVRHVAALLLMLCVLVSVATGQAQTQTARIEIDASKVEGQISPLLYGQFAEFMFENIKGGLHAELILNRSFEEAPNVIGLSRHWERYPDDRNDDYGLNFRWVDNVSYPVKRNEPGQPAEHSLGVEAGDGVITRHGLYQSRIPVQGGLEYRGYLWIKSQDYRGPIPVALEADITDAAVSASADSTNSSSGRRRATRLRASVFFSTGAAISGSIRSRCFRAMPWTACARMSSRRSRHCARPSCAGRAATSRRIITGAGAWAHATSV